MILTVDETGGIGFKNGLPWPKITQDLNWFKQLTEENVIVMGSTTWKSLGIHAPLKHRHNYVISSNHKKDDFPGCFAVRNPSIDSIEVILTALDFSYPEQDVFVIGGKTLYDEAYQFCDAMFVTRVHDTYIADTKVNIEEYTRDFVLLNQMYSQGNQHCPDITFETYLKAENEVQQDLFDFDDDIPF